MFEEKKSAPSILLYILSSISLAFSLYSCARPQQQESTPAYNVDVKVQPDDHARIAGLREKLQNAIALGPNAAPMLLSDTLLFSLTAEEKKNIDELFDGPTALVCNFEKRACEGEAFGSAPITFVATKVQKKPTITLDTHIKMSLRLLDTPKHKIIEVCRSKGITVTSNGLGGNFDGAFIKIKPQDNPPVVESMVVDFGIFGSYPTGDCDF